MKRIMRKIIGYSLILAIVFFSFRLYTISDREVVNYEGFTDYFQMTEAENGGLELTTSNFTTFEKEYNFTKEDEKEKKKEEEKKTAKKVEQLSYKVQKKDTPQAIARKFGLKTDTILLNNESVRNKKMKPGDTLTFPSVDGMYYKIQKGDTLAKIAKKYGISVVDIVDNNNINPKRLTAGTELFLKGVTLKKVKELEEKAVAAQQAKEDKKDKKKSKDKGQVPAVDTGSSGTGSSAEDNDNQNYSSGGAGFIYPVRYAGISSPFGNRYHPVLRRYILHTGVDLVAKYAPLRAAKAGVVTFAGNMSGYGKIIIINHGNGYETRYAHLSVISTNVGEHVNQGDLIGKTGNSGRTTGAHLHFEIRVNGVPKNPMKYIN